MENEEKDRKLARKQSIINKKLQKSFDYDMYEDARKQKHEIKNKKQQIEEEEWEYWKNYYK